MTADELRDRVRERMVEKGLLDANGELSDRSRAALAGLLQQSDSSRSPGTCDRLADRIIKGKGLPHRTNLEWVAETFSIVLQRDAEAERSPRARRSNERVGSTNRPPAYRSFGASGGNPQSRDVRRSVRVGFSGAQNVGKTELVDELEKSLRIRPNVGEVVKYNSPGADLIKEGISRDNQISFDHYAIWFERYLTDLKPQPGRCIIHDRSFFDALAYAEVNQLRQPWIQMFRELGHVVAAQFQVYFYMPIEQHVQLVDNGIRDITNIEYREKVNTIMEVVFV